MISYAIFHCTWLVHDSSSQGHKMCQWTPNPGDIFYTCTSILFQGCLKHSNSCSQFKHLKNERQNKEDVHEWFVKNCWEMLKNEKLNNCTHWFFLSPQHTYIGKKLYQEKINFKNILRECIPRQVSVLIIMHST